MVIEFDFEIYKNGDYDKVYLRNGKEARVLCDNGKVYRDWSEYLGSIKVATIGGNIVTGKQIGRAHV